MKYYDGVGRLIFRHGKFFYLYITKNYCPLALHVVQCLFIFPKSFIRIPLMVLKL